MYRIYSGLTLLVLALLGTAGCGRDAKNIFFPSPPGEARPDVQLEFSIPVPERLLPFVADGDSVRISGTVCKTWSEQNFKTREHVGFVQDGTIRGLYRRLADGDRYFAAELWIIHNGDEHRVFDGIPVNGSILTAVTTLDEESQNRFSFGRAFKTYQTGDGLFLINTLRDDNPKMAWTTFQYTGIGSSDPDSVYLNDPATPDKPMFLISAWSDFNRQPGLWRGPAWEHKLGLPPGLWYVRPENQDGAFKRTGCYLGNLELVHIVNIIDNNDEPYWAFLVRSVDGHVENAGPDNRYGTIDIGYPLVLPRGMNILEWSQRHHVQLISR